MAATMIGFEHRSSSVNSLFFYTGKCVKSPGQETHRVTGLRGDFEPGGTNPYRPLIASGGRSGGTGTGYQTTRFPVSSLQRPPQGIGGEPKSPLFRASNGKTKILSDRPLDRKDAFGMVQRRAKAAGIQTKIGCHTFRATGITIYLTNGGDLEKAQQMAAHESPRTTKLYDRRSDVVSLDEVEKVVF
jgi:integrase/recombinase XerD